MKYQEIVSQLEQFVAECECYAKEYGDKAMELLGDYPLYASTSNISYGEGILIASVFGHIDRQTDGAKLVDEYFKTLPKGQVGSYEGYEKWVREKEGRKRGEKGIRND